MAIPKRPEGALNQVPGTFNQQPGTGFKVFIKRFPDVNYYVYRLNVPSISLPAANEATPFIAIPKPGSQIQFDPLVMQFRVEEGLGNYTQLGDWMKIICSLYEPAPDQTIQYKTSPYAALTKHMEWTGEGVTCEILVSLTDSAKNVNLNMTFHDCWPTRLSELVFDASVSQVNYLQASVAFKYSYYEFTQP